MSNYSINAEVRTQLGKAQSTKVRNSGKIPAVYYGKGIKPLHLSIDPKQLEKAVASDMGTNTLMKLKVEGAGEYDVLLREYQADPIKRFFIHADFISVDLTKKIHISVRIHLVGKPVGVTDGGILDQVTREIEVLCFPTNIPKEINVDVTGLKVGQNLHFKDIKLPEGVEAFDDKANPTIAAVVAPREEKEPEPTAVAAEPEVLTAKKPEGEAAPAEGKDAGKDKKAEKK